MITTEKFILVPQKPELKAGGNSNWNPYFCRQALFLIQQKILQKEILISSHGQFAHIYSEPDKISKYYMSSGLIVIAYGKCFCENCLDMIISQDNFSELAKSSIPMTDKLFQQNFIDPLIHSNYNFSKSIGSIGVNEESPETWVSCATT